MSFSQVFGIAGIVILALVTLLWLLSLRLRNSGIVDIFWGAGFVICCWIYFAFSTYGCPDRKWLLTTLVTVWGFRLSIHILWRNRGKGEDFRYLKWRREAGFAWWWQSYFRVFLLQGALLWIISTPLLVAQIRSIPSSLTWLDFAAIPVWLTGFFFEAVGDWQLAKFKKDVRNQGQVLGSGVWRFTRHPNYFGDALQWWAYFLIAVAAGGFWTVFSPAAMTYFLMRVSGVPLLEESLKQTKPGYREYIENTNSFVPWFPRRKG